jgi:hypothetical protein
LECDPAGRSWHVESWTERFAQRPAWGRRGPEGAVSPKQAPPVRGPPNQPLASSSNLITVLQFRTVLVVDNAASKY